MSRRHESRFDVRQSSVPSTMQLDPARRPCLRLPARARVRRQCRSLCGLGVLLLGSRCSLLLVGLSLLSHSSRQRAARCRCAFIIIRRPQPEHSQNRQIDGSAANSALELDCRHQRCSSWQPAGGLRDGKQLAAGANRDERESRRSSPLVFRVLQIRPSPPRHVPANCHGNGGTSRFDERSRRQASGVTASRSAEFTASGSETRRGEGTACRCCPRCPRSPFHGAGDGATMRGRSTASAGAARAMQGARIVRHNTSARRLLSQLRSLC